MPVSGWTILNEKNFKMSKLDKFLSLKNTKMEQIKYERQSNRSFWCARSLVNFSHNLTILNKKHRNERIKVWKNQIKKFKFGKYKSARR